MDVCLHPGAQEFLVAADPALRADPFSTNVIAVVASRVGDGTQPESPDNVWATVHDGSDVVGVAMQTPPFRLFVSLMPPAGARALARTLSAGGRVLPGVNGAVAATSPFAEAWEALTGRRAQVTTAMRLYRLGALQPPVGVPGTPTVATAADGELVASWFAAFHQEAQPGAPDQDWVAVASRRIGAGQIHLWTEASSTAASSAEALSTGSRQPVALAAASATAGGVARVGPVYTPRASRRRGFGAAVTAAATAAALQRGAQDVVLYTDLSNPTSNAIYQGIGFRPHHDADERVFV